MGLFGNTDRKIHYGEHSPMVVRTRLFALCIRNYRSVEVPLEDREKYRKLREEYGRKHQEWLRKNKEAEEAVCDSRKDDGIS